MKSKLFLFALPVLVISFLIVGYSLQDDPRNDAAPVSTDINYNVTQSDTNTPAGFPYPTIYNYNYSTDPITNTGTVGACLFKGKYYLNKWNTPPTMHKINNNGVNGGPGTYSDSVNNYNAGAGAIRDLTIAPDGSGKMYLWGGSASTVLYKLDSNGNRVASYTHAGAAYRTIAWDPNRKGFWSSNFSDNIVCRDTNGVIIKTLTNTLGGKYGMGFDSSSTADSAFLWVWSQSTTTGGPNELHRIHINSNTDTRTYLFPLVGTLGIAGGAEVFVTNNMLVLSLNYQNFAVVGYKLKDLAPPPVLGNTLVLVHDTTITSTTQRKADRDTLNVYLPRYVGNYVIKNFDAASVLPDLSTYNTIILQETSFDAVAVRYLSAAARDQIKTWLASGTPSSKKSLISIGGDQGYNYSRATSPAQDLTFAETYCNMVYRVDNGMATAPVIEGVATDVGNQRPMSASPPGGSYWPDGCSKFDASGITLYRYMNHTINDTLAGIGNVKPGYVVASLFQDPRYFTGGFGAVLKSTIEWVVANGGLITGTGNNNVVINNPESFLLSQNYPNPFNPSTKINFSIPKSGMVSLIVYDVLGKEVASLVNEVRNAGSYEVTFNASNLSSGAYFYRLQSGSFAETKKMFLLK